MTTRSATGGAGPAQASAPHVEPLDASALGAAPVHARGRLFPYGE